MKDQQVDRSDLRDAIRNLGQFERELTRDEIQTLRVEAASLTASARAFYEDVQRLREVRASGVIANYDAVKVDFSRQHGISTNHAESLVVSERRIGQNPSTAAAIFAHAMRSAIKIHNYSDDELIMLFDDLSSGLLRDRRVKRSVLAFEDLERMLVAPLVPLPLAQFQIDYVRTRFGYIRDRSRTVALRAEQELVRKFEKTLMKEWHKKTRGDRLRDSLLRGHIGCLACNHPLIANFNGRRGLACSDCGYQPFQTLFYACDCGSGAVVSRQPDFSAFELVRDAIRVLHTEKITCMGCNLPPSNEKFFGRLLSLPIPYPVNGYPTKTLIGWRKALGWKNPLKFTAGDDPDISPREALERTRGEPPERIQLEE